VTPSSKPDELVRLADTLTKSAETPKKRMLVIVNPHATTVSARLRNLVIYALGARFEVEAIDTQRRDHGIELCRDAASEGYDVVVAFGGDGTANEAVNGLAGSATPLTMLPGGLTNVIAQTLGIPNDVVDATERLLHLADRWEPRLIDLGSVNGRRFAVAAGIGLDAAVVARVERQPQRKARLRAPYYLYSAITTFLSSYLVAPPRLLVEVDGRELEGIAALVQNSDPYTFFGTRPVHMAEGAGLETGTLAGIVLERALPHDIPAVLVRALSEQLAITGHRRVEGFSGARELTVRAAGSHALPIQVDGDMIGESTVARFTVEPRALGVIA